MWQVLVSYFAADARCEPKGFFGIPAWYEYLYHADYVDYNSVSRACEYDIRLVTNSGLNLAPIALIGLGILDILLRLGALVAVSFIIYGGIQYVLSQGEPDKAKKAFGTILNAAIGLAVTVIAAAVVAFIGRAITS